MIVNLPPLPYAETALEPVISAQTVAFHYHKHHAGYVQKTLDLIKGTSFEGKELENIILEAAANSVWQTLFNNAAQSFNHTFYWHSLKPAAQKQAIPEVLEKAVNDSFGTLDNLKKELVQAGTNRFGSGWVWLVAENGALKVISTPNAQTPLTNGAQTPLLTIDVWEHAYYLDEKNNRAAYLQNTVDSLLNWEFAAHNLQKAQS